MTEKQQPRKADEKPEGTGEVAQVGTPAEFADYEGKSLDELRSEAKERGVAMNADVEKAELIGLLRRVDRDPDYDRMSLDDLRAAAKKQGVALDEEFEKAHLIGELRAADTHTN